MIIGISTNNQRIESIREVVTPEQVMAEFPMDEAMGSLVASTRQNVSQILTGEGGRLLAIVGPCSVHDLDAAMEYGEKLTRVRNRLGEDLEVIMRVYFEKPRTTVGWKGLINDPNLDETFDVNTGLRKARKLLVGMNQMGMPAASEFLDIVTGQYYADLVSWGAIGARTTESQVHRELASGLSCPVGLKNGTDGNIQIALDAIKSVNQSHIFLSPTAQGNMAIFRTTGNMDAHLILRGGEKPNYDDESVSDALVRLKQMGIDTGLVVDLSHANSEKQYARQIPVGHDVAKQIEAGQRGIVGFMLESHLVEGRQNAVEGKSLRYGQSITDGCLGWTDTERLLEVMARSVALRRKSK